MNLLEKLKLGSYEIDIAHWPNKTCKIVKKLEANIPGVTKLQLASHMGLFSFMTAALLT